MKVMFYLLSGIFMLATNVYSDVLIDDFNNLMDDADNKSYLGARFSSAEAGYWYSYNDKDTKGSSSCLQSFTSKTNPIIVKNTTGDRKNYLKANIALGKADVNSKAYFAVGLNLTEEDVYTDMSKMTALEFYAKGSGTFSVRFGTKKMKDEGTWGDMMYVDSLTSEWEKYTVDPQKIIPEEYSPGAISGVKWEAAKTAVTKIEFRTEQNPNTSMILYLDDIVVKGMEYDDFCWDDNYPNSGKLNGEGTPVAHNRVVTTKEDESVKITLTATDSDGVIKKHTIVDMPNYGLANISDSVLTYAPDDNFYGFDTLTFYATDNDYAKSNTAKIIINVTSVNDQDPDVENSVISLSEDDSKAVNFKAVDDGTVKFTIVKSPLNGKIEDGIYYPNANFNGKDTLTFFATDNDGAKSDTATIVITVNSVNDLPVVTNLIDSLEEDGSGKLVLNATDVDGTIDSIKIIKGISHGKLSFNGDTILYLPDSNFFGVDSFSYVAIDNDGGSSQAKGYFCIKSVNDGKPIFKTKKYFIDGDNKVKKKLQTEDANKFESVVKIHIVKQPINCEVEVDGLLFRYAPTEVKTLKDSMAVVLEDNDGAFSDTTIINIQVKGQLAILDYTPESQYNSDNIVLAPMPVRDKSTIIIDLIDAGKYSFTLLTQREQPIYTKVVKLNEGTHEIPFNAFENVRAGIYYLVVKKDNEVYAIKSVAKAK